MSELFSHFHQSPRFLISTPSPLYSLSHCVFFSLHPGVCLSSPVTNFPPTLRSFSHPLFNLVLHFFLSLLFPNSPSVSCLSLSPVIVAMSHNESGATVVSSGSRSKNRMAAKHVNLSITTDSSSVCLLQLHTSRTVFSIFTSACFLFFLLSLIRLYLISAFYFCLCLCHVPVLLSVS